MVNFFEFIRHRINIIRVSRGGGGGGITSTPRTGNAEEWGSKEKCPPWGV